MTTLDLGQKLPQVLSASLPWQDEAGLWVDLELEYAGVSQVRLQQNCFQSFFGKMNECWHDRRPW